MKLVIYPYRKKTPRLDKEVMISPAAIIMGDVTIKKDSSIWGGAIIRALTAPITIGESTNLQENVVVTTLGKQSTTIGDYVSIYPNATITSARIADNVHVGSGSTILPNAVIPLGCEIGPMTLITQRLQIPPSSYIVGVPGRVLRKLPEEKIQQNLNYTKTMAKTAASVFRVSED